MNISRAALRSSPDGRVVSELLIKRLHQANEASQSIWLVTTSNKDCNALETGSRSAGSDVMLLPLRSLRQ